MSEAYCNSRANCNDIIGEQPYRESTVTSRVRVYSVFSFFVIQIASLKTEKRTLCPFFVFLSAIRKTENDYKQTILVFLIYERKRKTVQQTVFRFLCIRTENEMRLQRHSFFVFRSSRSQLVCTCATRLRSCVWRVASFFFGVRIWLVTTFNYPVLWVRVKGQG